MTNDHALAGVIDGLGHGPFAHRAARTARHYIEAHYGSSPGEPLSKLAQHMLQTLGKTDDDATILVAGNAS